jgi:hypothetical protein
MWQGDEAAFRVEIEHRRDELRAEIARDRLAALSRGKPAPAADAAPGPPSWWAWPAQLLLSARSGRAGEQRVLARRPAAVRHRGEW